MRRDFILRGAKARSAMASAWQAACALLEIGDAARVTVASCRPTRTLQQNAKLWAMLHDVAGQVLWHVDGRQQHLRAEDWKDIFTAGLRKHQRVAPGIEGGFVLLGARTSRMSVQELGDLIELIYAFGAEHDVKWSDPAELEAA